MFPLPWMWKKGACTGGSKTVGFHYVRIVGGDSAGRVSQIELVLADLDAFGFERPEHRNADLGQFVLVRHDGHLRPLLDDVALEVEHRDVGERAARVERAEEVVVRLPLGVVEPVFVDVVALPVVVGGAARAVSRLEEARPGDGRQRRGSAPPR